MSSLDADEVLNHLSIKFNKIFCDRDFVCCVIQDFQRILDNKEKICILVFPTLGPIYLKALRYQAKISDLSVFNISSASGKFKSVAVCHKDHLKKATPIMSESKRKRPERQLYVPPAQRTSRLSSKPQCDKKVTTVKSVPSLSEVNLVHLIATLPVTFDFRQVSKMQHHNCQFKRYLTLKHDYSFIKIYDNFSLLNNVYLKLNLTNSECCEMKSQQSFPVFQFDVESEKPVAILFHNELNHFDTTVMRLNDFESDLYKVECDISDEYFDMIDFQQFGHMFIVTIDGSDYFHECQEIHDTTDCYKNVRQQLELSKRNDRIIEPPKREPIVIKETPKTKLKNEINKKKKVSDNKHEQEKEIMRMTKEHINRKTRPIMKYVDDRINTLKIDHDVSVNNWEDLFDDDGQIQETLLSEIVDKVGDDITIIKAGEDYTEYTNKPPEDLEHIVELYNFPSSLETHDLVQAFSDINSDAMYIKWVDDTHALLVLGSLSQAQKAMSMRNPMIKVRPMTDASPISIDVANKSDLRPAMKRPPTNLQTARRLITTHLGAKTKLTKEQIAKERQDLKNAREMKRLLKQNEKDAWEGNLRSSVQ